MSKEPKKLSDMECDELKEHCPWEGAAVSAGPNGPISCEGRYCEEAYQQYCDSLREEE